jgi:hypothetical protein
MSMNKLFLALLGFVLLSGSALFAQGVPPKIEKKGGIPISFKVTDIKGNVITIKDDNGISKTLELASLEGIKIGTKATCEEDCGKGLKIGDKVIKVQKVIK